MKFMFIIKNYDFKLYIMFLFIYIYIYIYIECYVMKYIITNYDKLYFMFFCFFSVFLIYLIFISGNDLLHK
jgi:hypothetical protein